MLGYNNRQYNTVPLTKYSGIENINLWLSFSPSWLTSCASLFDSYKKQATIVIHLCQEAQQVCLIATKTQLLL
jgi:hypothetical protein